MSPSPKQSLSSYLLSQIPNLAPSIPPSVISSFQARIQHNPSLIRQENPRDHFCCFFLPLDPKTKQVFLVHHKKANDWIPPGGHIEPQELPRDTIKREFREELGINLNNKPLNLVYLTVKPVKSPHSPCRKHYDLWYQVNMPLQKIPNIDSEFHQSSWFSFTKALTQTRHPLDRQALAHIINQHHQYT